MGLNAANQMWAAYWFSACIILTLFYGLVRSNINQGSNFVCEQVCEIKKLGIPILHV